MSKRKRGRQDSGMAVRLGEVIDRDNALALLQKASKCKADEQAVKVFNSMIPITSDVSRHSYGVLDRLVSVYEKFGVEVPVKLCNTVLMHDIGKSEAIVCDKELGHEMIGYEFLADNPIVYSKAIRDHGKGKFKEDVTEEEKLATVILDYCDITVDSKGNVCTVDERIKDIKNRYGCGSKEYKEVIKRKTYIVNTCLGIKSAIINLDKIIKEG